MIYDTAKMRLLFAPTEKSNSRRANNTIRESYIGKIRVRRRSTHSKLHFLLTIGIILPILRNVTVWLLGHFPRICKYNGCEADSRYQNRPFQFRPDLDSMGMQPRFCAVWISV